MASVTRGAPPPDAEADPREGETARLDRIEAEILRAVRRIRYGSVEITIHDSRVVQIEQKEKVRVDEIGTARRHR